MTLTLARRWAACGLLGLLAATPLSSTAAAAPSIVGTWTVSFDWDCNGQPGTGTWFVQADGTFTDNSGNAGTWTQNGKAFNMHYPVNHFDYTGKLHKGGNKAAGIIYSAVDGDVGCWKATR